MRRLPYVLLVIAALQPSLIAQPPSPHVATTPPLTPAEQVKKFHLPPGFVIELVAAEPDINKPINIAFDAKGRLWVTGSVEYPFPAKKGEKPRDKLKVLSDFGPDGKVRKVETFADGLNIPIGVLPLADCKSALVFSIPNIYLMTDSNGDGKADKREILYGPFGADDTHGMTGEFMWGLDGWVYCCHGFANTSHVKSRGKTAITMQSGNTYRIKPDGSKIEQYTWGQVNPFGLAFDPLGNLYSADCHSRPIYQLIKGAYYPSFGKPHDGLGFGPEMVTHEHGSTAICGIVYYAADQFPKEFHDNIFIGNVITNRINRDRIEWHGSSPKGIEMPDFVTCDDPWFRPVDIKLGPDGCLYVADFYNRIIGHYEVPLDHPGRDREKGRIWRIRYRGEQREVVPQKVEDLTAMSNADLLTRLNSLNLAVRTDATNLLAERGGDEVVELMAKAVRKGSQWQRLYGLWVLTRLGKLQEQELAAVTDTPFNIVRVHAMKALAEMPKWSEKQHALALAGLKDADPSVQRAAAEALGTKPMIQHVYRLAELKQKVPAEDSHLLHAVRLALRNQWRDPEVAKSIPRLAWPATGGIDAVADVCLGVPSSDAAYFLWLYGLKDNQPLAVLHGRMQHIVRYGREDDRAGLLNKLRNDAGKSADYLVGALKAFAHGTQERGVTLTDAERRWAEDTIIRLLDSTAAKSLHEAIELAGFLKVNGAQVALLDHAKNARTPTLRKAAIASLVRIEPRKHVTALSRILLDDSEVIEVREQVAASLAGANQTEALVAAFEKAPARLQANIAQGMAGSPQGAPKLLEIVAQGKASARLLQDRAVVDRLRQARIPDIDQRLAKLTKGLPTADERLQQLVAQRKTAFAGTKADVAVGFKLFTKHCAACHQIANQGTKIGPQLDGIGIRGLERLLEDVLDPNRNVDQAFRATTILKKDGQVFTGLFLRQDGKALVLADNLGKEVRINEADVDERNTSQLSPMPGNFHEQVGANDFNHLMAYLLEQRPRK